jgi:hypothetical protein
MGSCASNLNQIDPVRGENICLVSSFESSGK